MLFLRCLRAILYWLLTASSCIFAEELGANVAGCQIAKKLADVGDISAYSKLGDCYSAGVLFEKNEHNAREWYMKAALNGDDYGLYKAGFSFLFFSMDETDKLLGEYIFQDLIENSDAVSISGYAAYYLGVNALKFGDDGIAKEYFALGVSKSNLDAMYALAYINYEQDEAQSYISSAEEQLTKNGLDVVSLSFVCWIDLQERRDISFPINLKKYVLISNDLGSCN